MKISIIVPVYNEEQTVATILSKVVSVLSGLETIDDWEIILVDDCSTDGTRAVLEGIVAGNDRFLILFQPVNQGKGAALRAGITRSSGDIVLVQDADLEYDPQDYRVLIQPIADGKADVVYGSRFKGETTRVLYFWHYMGNRFLTFLSNMFTNLNLTDMETCYKAFRGDLIRSMHLVSSRFGIEPEITAKIAKIPDIRIYEVPISYFGRTYAEGKKINWKDGCSAIWSILKFNLLATRSVSFHDKSADTRG